MGKITLSQAAQWCGGRIDPKYKDVAFLGANNDTRKLAPGQLFVALQGARDGHDFIPAALEKGAAAVLCTHCDGDWPAIVVEDTRIALGLIAKQERQRIGMKVVGITGSVGKSTTKEMVAKVLSSAYATAKTPANHNNDIGMPMAILGMSEDTEVAVLEMGMNHFREIAYLSDIAKPDIGVIINIGTMHIEHLGSREGILRAKMEILEGMREDGKVILNGDDDMLWGQRNKHSMHFTYFGRQNMDCALTARDVRQAEGAIGYLAFSNGFHFPVELPVEGLHHVTDSLAAIAVGMELGVDPAALQERLSGFQNMAGRQEIYEKNGYTIINDCYNAGPESMSAALQVLGAKPGRKIAVLGDMLELGVCSQAEHYRVGRIAAENAQMLFAYGPHAKRMIGGAVTGGLSDSKARAFEDRDALIRALSSAAKPGDVLLFKGSRGMHMELALEGFLKNTEE